MEHSDPEQVVVPLSGAGESCIINIRDSTMFIPCTGQTFHRPMVIIAGGRLANAPGDMLRAALFEDVVPGVNGRNMIIRLREPYQGHSYVKMFLRPPAHPEIADS